MASQCAALGVQPVPPPREAELRAQIAHFAIFNPSIPAPPRHPQIPNARADETPGPAHGEQISADKSQLGQGDQAGHEPTLHAGDDDMDMDKDDMEQAAQIVFYTCPTDPAVPMNVKLKQVGLVRGLMAFTSAVAPGDEPWWSVHSNNARMLVWIADGYHFYVNIRNGKGWSDRMVADLLARGYQNFCLLHGPLPSPPSPSDLANIQTFYLSFIASLDNVHLAAPPSSRLHTWLGHVQPSPIHHNAGEGAIDVLIDDMSGQADAEQIEEIGIITPTQTYRCADRALERHLRSVLLASCPQPISAPIRRPPGRIEDDARSRKISLGWAWPFGTSRPSTPSSERDGAGRTARASVSTRCASVALGRSGTDSGEGAEGGKASADGSRRSSVDKVKVRVSDATDVLGPGIRGDGAAARAGSEDSKSTWMSLGNVPSAIGGAVGSMGTMFGLKSAETSRAPAVNTIRAHELFPESAQVSSPSKTALADHVDSTRTGTGTEVAGKGDVSERGEADAPAEAVEAEAGKADTLDGIETESMRSILQPSVQASELADAQEELPAISTQASKVVWESREFWLARIKDRRLVKWTIKVYMLTDQREGILLFFIMSQSSTMLSNPSGQPPSPTSAETSHQTGSSDGPVLSLFNKLSSILRPDPSSSLAASASSPSHHTSRGTRGTSPSARHRVKTDSAIWRMADGQSVSVGEGKAVEAPVFADLRDMIIRHPTIEEVYTRTSATAPPKPTAAGSASSHVQASGAQAQQYSVFVGVRRSEGEETYLAVGKVDASLVDAENSMRTMLRSRPEVAS